MSRGGSVSLPTRGGDTSGSRSTYVAPGVTYREVTQYVAMDGEMTTATVFEMTFAYGDATPLPIFNLGADVVIAEVNVWMLDAFDGVGAKINVGKATLPEDLMANSEIDPSFLSSYQTRPGKEYVSGETVNLYITPGAGASHGRGVLSIYVI